MQIFGFVWTSLASAPFKSTLGVKQGCPMPPTLFGLYIDRLEHQLQSHDQDAPNLLDTKVPILLYPDDIVLLSQSPSSLQPRLNVLQLFCAEKLLSVNMSNTQVVIFNHSRSDSFLFSHRQLQIVEQYTYLGIVLHKSGPYKNAISKLTSAGKRDLFAMQYRCSDLGIDDIKLRCSLFSSLVQPGCDLFSHMAVRFGVLGIQKLECYVFNPSYVYETHLTCLQIRLQSKVHVAPFKFLKCSMFVDVRTHGLDNPNHHKTR